MLTDYIHVMEGVISSEKLEFLTRANTLFHTYTQTHTDILIGTLMDNNGSREYSDMLDEVYTFIEEGMDYLSDEIGFDFADISIADKMLLLETFKQLEDFDDSDTIVKLLEADTPLHERITDVLSFVAGRDWTEFTDLFSDVTIETLNSILRSWKDTSETSEFFYTIMKHDPNKELMIKIRVIAQKATS